MTLSRAQSRALDAMNANGGWLPAKKVKKATALALLNSELIHYSYDKSLGIATYRLGKRTYEPTGVDYLLQLIGEQS